MQFRSVGPPVIVALVVLVVGAAIHGALTDRFGMIQSDQLKQFNERLSHVPVNFGPWEGEDTEVDAAQLERARATGHVSRTYRNAETGEQVSLFLVSGTSRHITLHTPELCYQAAGFTREGELESVTVDIGAEHPVELITGKFYREEDDGRLSQLRIWWAFSNDGIWLGPRWARTSLAGTGSLYKLYLIAPIPAGAREARSEMDVLKDFVQAAMPGIQRTLFPADGQQ